MKRSSLGVQIGFALLVLAGSGSAAAANAPHPVFPERPDAAGQPLGPNAIVFDTSVGGIHVVNADGTGYRNLVPQVGPRRPQWSPDGRRIVYEKTRDVFGGERPTNRIIVMNADGGGRRTLARGWDPAWSRDGREIYFHRVRGTLATELIPGLPIFAVNVRTRKVRPLGISGATLRTRDGRLMVVGGDYRPNIDRRTGTSPDAYTIVPVDGSPLTTVEVPRPVAFGTRQTWSPDGSFVYSCFGRNSVSDVCTYHPFRKRLRVLPSPRGVSEYEAAFSPNGRRFAASGTDGLYVRDLRSGRLTWLWRNPGAGQGNSHAPFSPHWRPSPP